MKNKLYYIFILLTAMSLGGCSKTESELQFVNLDGEFIIKASQHLTPQGPDFLLSISTLNVQECAASEIKYRIVDEESGINLIIEDITVIEDCSTTSGIIHQNIPITTNQMTTDIAISLKDVVKNKGKITITDNEYLLSLNSVDGIIIGRKRVNRIPTNLVFGYIESLDGSSLNPILSSLSQFSEGEIQDGDYALFTKSGPLLLLANPAETENALNVYFMTTDKAAFDVELEQLILDNPLIDFNLTDAFGKRY